MMIGGCGSSLIDCLSSWFDPSVSTPTFYSIMHANVAGLFYSYYAVVVLAAELEDRDILYFEQIKFSHRKEGRHGELNACYG
jgi:hypothetical protein